MIISEILLKYKTDKNYGGHYYGESYGNILKRFNKDDKLNILEIGTQKGDVL